MMDFLWLVFQGAANTVVFVVVIVLPFVLGIMGWIVIGYFYCLEEVKNWGWLVWLAGTASIIGLYYAVFKTFGDPKTWGVWI